MRIPGGEGLGTHGRAVARAVIAWLWLLLGRISAASRAHARPPITPQKAVPVVAFLDDQPSLPWVPIAAQGAIPDGEHRSGPTLGLSSADPQI